MTIVVPFSNSAPRTVPGTVTGKDTAVPAVVPTVESTVGISFRWFFERRADLNLGSGDFVFVDYCAYGLAFLRDENYGVVWGGQGGCILRRVVYLLVSFVGRLVIFVRGRGSICCRRFTCVYIVGDAADCI